MILPALDDWESESWLISGTNMTFNYRVSGLLSGVTSGWTMCESNSVIHNSFRFNSGMSLKITNFPAWYSTCVEYKSQE